MNLLLYLETLLADPSKTALLTEAERENLRANLLNSALQRVLRLLIQSGGTEMTGVEAEGGGPELLEQIFRQKCRELFPDYQALRSSPQADADGERYLRLLEDRSLKLSQKRGSDSLRISTGDLLARMSGGATVQTSQFDALKSRLGRLGLMTVRDCPAPAVGQGEAGNAGELELTAAPSAARPADKTPWREVRLTSHPLEETLCDAVERRGEETTLRRGGRETPTKRLRRQRLMDVGSRLGYGDDETAFALKLAFRRQRLSEDGEYVLRAVPEDDPALLAADARQLLEEAGSLTPYLPAEVKPYRERLTAHLTALPTANAEALNEAGFDLGAIREGLRALARAQAGVREAERRQLQTRLGELLRRLPGPELERPLDFPGTVSGKLENIQDTLRRSVGRTRDAAERLGRELGEANFSDIAGGDELARAISRRDDWTRRIEGWEGEGETLGTNARLFERWRNLGRSARQLEREIGERHPELRRKVEDWNDAVQERFNKERLGLLAAFEEFDTSPQGLRSEVIERVAAARREFQAFEDEVRRRLLEAKLPSPRGVAFDPENPDVSFECLAEEAAESLRAAFSGVARTVDDLRERCAFLREVRHRSVGPVEDSLTALRERLAREHAAVTASEILKLRQGGGLLDALLGAYRDVIEARGRADDELRPLDAAEPVTPGDEAEVAGALTESSTPGRTDLSLADLYRRLRKGGAAPNTDLFQTLRVLYEKGVIEINLRDRRNRG